MKQCDAIFVSHIHGDHYDPDTIMNIHERTKASILAPEEVLESLKKGGISDKFRVHIEDQVGIKIKDISVTPLSGYDNSFDKEGRPNKFSIILSAGDTVIFFSGDCHGVPPKIEGQTCRCHFLLAVSE